MISKDFFFPAVIIKDFFFRQRLVKTFSVANSPRRNSHQRPLMATTRKKKKERDVVRKNKSIEQWA